MTDREKGTKEPGIRFSETMSGYLAEGVEDFEEGERRGREQGTPFSFDVTIEIESVSDFIKLSGQEARMTGTVSSEALGESSSDSGGSVYPVQAECGNRKKADDLLFLVYGQGWNRLLPLRL